MIFRVISVLLLLWAYSEEFEQPIVTTSLGKIKGHFKQSYKGRTFSAFEGIPYAKPPVGKLRFKEPQKVDIWFGIWEATTIHECIQMAWPNIVLTGNEDCLYINVYVPKEKPIPNEDLDVIVHMHGGGFMLGSPKIAGPEYLMDRDVIYVNLNYRVGILGFLSTEDDVISGNNGLKDQVLALKWVQDNIAHFGGNPKSVTIVGLSAGGASVHFHYFSPLSKGLFHRGISHSGTALAPWTIQEAPLKKAKKLAASVGCNQQGTKDFVECMRQRSARQLVQNVQIFYADYRSPFAPFAPVVEKKHTTSFLTNFPFKLLQSGHVYDVPWIVSATTEEGVYPAVLFVKTLDKLEEQWNQVMPHSLDYNYTVEDSDKVDVSQKIKQFYFGEEKVSRDNFQTLIKLFSDRHFHIDFEVASQMQAKVTKSPVYTLLYGHRGDMSIGNFFDSDPHEFYGVSHADDSLLLYYMDIPGFATLKKLSSSDESIKELLVNIVTSFATRGTPELKNIEWKPVTNSNAFEYLFIQNPDEVEMASKEKSKAIEFWRSLPIFENGNIAPVKDEL